MTEEQTDLYRSMVEAAYGIRSDGYRSTKLHVTKAFHIKLNVLFINYYAVKPVKCDVPTSLMFTKWDFGFGPVDIVESTLSEPQPWRFNRVDDRSGALVSDEQAAATKARFAPGGDLAST